VTASEEQISAAKAAVEAGMATAEQYWQSAAEAPGTGWAVSLPSYPHPTLGPVKGLNYDTPGDPAPMPGRPHLKLTPDYSTPSDVVGGALHVGAPGRPGLLDGSQTPWPASQAQPSSVARRSSVHYVPATTRQTLRSRLREAWSTLLGR
jgi:hypothetical protein